jgi:GntR family transcriptional repressor for pyruvate dehydrogenase complex
MPGSRTRKTITISRISVQKSYDLLANQLRDKILRGEISEGDPLPTERELVTLTGLSRGSVREALRMLAVEGLVKSRQGRSGGNIVTLPGNESMGNAINQFVQGRRLPLRTLQETREALEPTLAGLAAQRRTAEDLERLRSLQDQLIAAVDDFEKFSLINIKWHNAVAGASDNQLLAAFLSASSYGITVATTTQEYDTMDTRKEVIRIHARINDAIESRNAELAERRMRQHIRATHLRATTPGTASIPLSDDVTA